MQCWKAAVLLLAAAVSACSPGRAKDPPTTESIPTIGGTDLPTSSTSTTATTAADPFAVPAVIDAAYVNRVLGALNKVDGDALRLFLSSRSIDLPVREHLRAIYNDPKYDVEVQGVGRVLGHDLTVFKTPPGDERTDVVRILVARQNCIVVETRLDYSAVLHDPPPRPPDELNVIVLVPTQPGADPSRLNPTLWSIRYDELIKAGQTAKDTSCDG